MSAVWRRRLAGHGAGSVPGVGMVSEYLFSIRWETWNATMKDEGPNPVYRIATKSAQHMPALGGPSGWIVKQDIGIVWPERKGEIIVGQRPPRKPCQGAGLIFL